ncbi:MAG: hypothetical protein HYU97_02585 [Deltaproteobacteria bacterium]|nr:hypothetical protein [Deltaproteobacteria bacterium]
MFLLLSVLNGLLVLRELIFDPKLPLGFPFLSSTIISFLIVLLFVGIARQFLISGDFGEVISLVANLVIGGNYVQGFLLTLTHGLLPILLYLGILQSCRTPSLPQENIYLKSPLLPFFYFLPVLIYLVIFISLVAYLGINDQKDPKKFSELLPIGLLYLSGSTIIFSLGMLSFFIPSSLLYLTRSRQTSLRQLLDLPKFIKKTLLPFLILLPLVNGMYFLVAEPQVKQITSTAIPMLIPFIYLPMALIVGMALSRMHSHRRSGYHIMIGLAALFMILNLSLVSLVLGLVIIYYSTQGLKTEVP